jgi:hypothetical protein
MRNANFSLGTINGGSSFYEQVLMAMFILVLVCHESAMVLLTSRSGY